MAGGLSTRVDADDFGRVAAAMKTADKDLKKAIRKALRDSAKPLGEAVLQVGSEPMPKRGGLRDRMRGRKIGILFAAGSNPKITMKLGTSKKDVSLKFPNDKGLVRHPVYPRGGDRKEWRWVAQKVPEGTFTKAFEAGAPLVRRQVLDATQGVLDDIARKV